VQAYGALSAEGCVGGVFWLHAAWVGMVRPAQLQSNMGTDHLLAMLAAVHQGLHRCRQQQK
jgi:hypothetical protein